MAMARKCDACLNASVTNYCHKLHNDNYHTAMNKAVDTVKVQKLINNED